MAIEEKDIVEALRPVEDPELHRSIVDLGMVDVVDLSDPAKIEITIKLTIPGCPLKAEINDRVTQAVTPLAEGREITVLFGSMTDEERAALSQQLGGGQQQAGEQKNIREIPFSQPDSKTRVLLVASGKGGVGKSSVTANLAVALANRGKSVAVLDADVWGFSIPRMLGASQDPTIIDEMIIPPENHGVKCISMGFFVEEDEPVIWRGPMLHKALEQFLVDVYWDEPDFLIVDLPPGTGDIALSIAQFLPTAELFVVTTPQQVAQQVAQRAAFMAHKVRTSVAGVIENMSWFTGDDGKRYDLFGEGGGQALAELLEVPLLAQIPLTVPLRQGADEGNPIALDATSGAGEVFAKLAETVDKDLAPRKKFSAALKVS